MNLSSQIAKHFREVHVGGNWTWSNYKDQLADVTWEQALKQVDSFNTIAVLTFHHGYFVNAVLKVFKGEPLNSHDKDSFAHPPINSQEDWQSMVTQLLSKAEELAGFIEKTPTEKWEDIFVKEKYGNYYRNVHGMIEHAHYHLGQIALIKKLVQQ
jgi:hypothetical protein